MVLSVADQGAGISPEDREKIFEPFYTTKFTGRGLGLAVVYSAVQEHGGSVDIVSAPGDGTTITVELPAPLGEA